jgi:hypothetical protein
MGRPFVRATNSKDRAPRAPAGVSERAGDPIILSMLIARSDIPAHSLIGANPEFHSQEPNRWRSVPDYCICKRAMDKIVGVLRFMNIHVTFLPSAKRRIAVCAKEIVASR